MRVRSFLSGSVSTSALAEHTSVDTAPTGVTERTSFPRGGEYTRGTSFHTPKFHLVRVTVTITSEVSDVTQCVWLPDSPPRLGTAVARYRKEKQTKN